MREWVRKRGSERASEWVMERERGRHRGGHASLHGGACLLSAGARPPRAEELPRQRAVAVEALQQSRLALPPYPPSPSARTRES